MAAGHFFEQPLDVRLLLSIKTTGGRPSRPGFGHPTGVIAMKPVRGY